MNYVKSCSPRYVPEVPKFERNCKNGLTVIRDRHEVQVVKTGTELSHNPTGPAFRRYDYDLNVGVRYKSLELWMVNGIIHRDDDLPASISYLSTEFKYEELYFKHGKKP